MVEDGGMSHSHGGRAVESEPKIMTLQRLTPTQTMLRWLTARRKTQNSAKDALFIGQARLQTLPRLHGGLAFLGDHCIHTRANSVN